MTQRRAEPPAAINDDHRLIPLTRSNDRIGKIGIGDRNWIEVSPSNLGTDLEASRKDTRTREKRRGREKATPRVIRETRVSRYGQQPPYLGCGLYPAL